MSRVANPSARTYRSQLREEQAEATRSRILDAALRVMARGIASVSIPDVAREAGVSVPTVYRHFATKQDLLDAVYPHAERRAGRSALNLPRGIGSLRAGVRQVLDNVEALDDLTRAAMASPAAEEVRHRSMPMRLGLVREMLETVDPPLTAEARDRIARLLVILTSTSSLRTWRVHLGISPDGVAEEIERAILAAIAAAQEDEG